jgi:hypothetical protein
MACRRHYIPKSIAINVPDAIPETFSLCVGVESKSDERVNYSSSKVVFDITNINHRCKEIIIEGMLK